MTVKDIFNRILPVIFPSFKNKAKYLYQGYDDEDYSDSLGEKMNKQSSIFKGIYIGFRQGNKEVWIFALLYVLLPLYIMGWVGIFGSLAILLLHTAHFKTDHKIIDNMIFTVALIIHTVIISFLLFINTISILGIYYFVAGSILIIVSTYNIHSIAK